ncbi:hypothetical protein ACJ3XI_04780 [Litorimonas sp. RW-G-Af-16]|uniref:hypothetical protein n=1 Tax=Litorimonas sp. RW-G-Af-16 TaxID=3241168 RepID=UPI00390CD0E9
MSFSTTKRLMAGVIGSALLAAVSYVPLANAFGVGVQPSTVEMTIKPGDRQRQVVTVGNVHKTKTISLTMGLADWTLDKDGKLVLDAPGDTDRSAAEWVRFSPASVTLKPETSQDITVEISAPYKIEHKGDHRFALLATTMLPELNERGETSGVWNRYQLASLFYLTLTPSESLPEVTSVALNPADKSIVTMQIKNEGDAHARLQGKAYVKSAAGEVVAETPLNAVVLDGGERTYNVKLENMAELESGNYKIDFDLNNSFAPQNKFRAMDVDVQSIEYVAE